jgi:hypothetical protein
LLGSERYRAVYRGIGVGQELWSGVASGLIIPLVYEQLHPDAPVEIYGVPADRYAEFDMVTKGACVVVATPLLYLWLRLHTATSDGVLSEIIRDKVDGLLSWASDGVWDPDAAVAQAAIAGFDVGGKKEA